MKIDWIEVKLDAIIKDYVARQKLADGESLFSFKSYVGNDGHVAIKRYINAKEEPLVTVSASYAKPCEGGYWTVGAYSGSGGYEGVCSKCGVPAKDHRS